jgi:hypothetical protein
MKYLRFIRLLPGALLPLLLVITPAQATVVHYVADLTGSAEFPPNASTATGQADVYFDDAALTLRIIVSFSGLMAPVTAAHIHAATAVANSGTAGVATQTPSFTGFPAGVTSGAYDHTFDLTLNTSFRAGYITANGGSAATATAALVAALDEQKAYLNIHTSQYPGGEIRGFLRVPDAGSTALLLALGMIATVSLARSKRFGT